MTRAIIETENGNIELELFDEETPNTVKNFVSLAEEGFYDGVVFHRVVPDFVIQGGDPTGTGSGGPGYAIPCECRTAGKQKHVLGALSMAHAGIDTGGSQFFVVLNPDNCKHLDRKHTVFGVVTKGMDVVNRVHEGTEMKTVRILEKSEKIANWELNTL
ncbi:MAG: peptidylprolyl isomerase [Candidatus Odinarchaeota archaeon]